MFDDHRPRLQGLSLGKGCIRYPSPERVDWDVVSGLLQATRERDDPIC